MRESHARGRCRGGAPASALPSPPVVGDDDGVDLFERLDADVRSELQAAYAPRSAGPLGTASCRTASSSVDRAFEATSKLKLTTNGP
eukprot:7369568-Prymnesium_polylepis.2